jgi:hypothetical protein
VVAEAYPVGDLADPPHDRGSPGYPAPELLEWLDSGRLLLVDEMREPVSRTRWNELPPQVQANAAADFSRVARGNAKAVILYLRP